MYRQKNFCCQQVLKSQVQVQVQVLLIQVRVQVQVPRSCTRVQLEYKYKYQVLQLYFTAWLRVPQRIEYKVAVMTYKVAYFVELQRRDIWDRSHWSVTYLAGGHCTLPTPVAFWCHPSRLSIVGNRAFTVAGPLIWNLLLEETTSTTAQSLSTFRQRLKTFLFMKSYPDVIF